jgi:signal transduction histidine kinase
MSAVQASDKGITLEIADCETDLLIDADETALGVMVGQLVENAVAFTQAGGAVCLNAWRDQGCIWLTIADNGPRVAAEDLARILEPFEQVGRGTTDHTKGAGLGLPLVKALAELHGGTLAVDGTVGAGFKATLQLPQA